MPAAQQEFENICEEFDLVAKLNQLDEAYGAGREVSALEEQMGQVSPGEKMREVRMQLKTQERDELKALAQKADQECIVVRERLAAQRQQVLAMEKSINDAAQELTEVTASCILCLAPAQHPASDNHVAIAGGDGCPHVVGATHPLSCRRTQFCCPGRESEFSAASCSSRS